MSRVLKAQLVGFHHPCIAYGQEQIDEYYEFLSEADEFGAAAGTYPEERSELIANAAHRYQLLIDLMSQNLHLNVSFLSQGKIWFNFYSEIASRFGLGTQAYTTETLKPHVGVSEISLQDPELLQLILIHEMQHAIDFANYSGLKMTISERELRARISICEGLFPLSASKPRIYGNAVQDLAFWFIIFYLTAGISEENKLEYYRLLNRDVHYLLSQEARGILFSPMILRALAKELQRDKISLTSLKRYVIEEVQGKLKLKLLNLEADDEISEEQPDLLESLMLEDQLIAPNTVQMKSLNPDDIQALTVDYSREVLTTKNQVMDWQAYDQNYAKLKEQAQIIIERDQKSFEKVQVRLEKGSDHTLTEKLFPQLAQIVETEPQVLDPRAHLSNLAMPEAILTADEVSQAETTLLEVPVHLEPLQSGQRHRHNIDELEPTIEDMMSDLSDFVKEKGSR